ncbi:MAG: conjugal transfer protein TraF, partial [Chlamydiae bacterium]|nr:conjugal transfer protein TraF [Chlamydiota bacterium]
MKRTLLCLFISFFPFFAYSSWYEKKLEGWYYFEDLKEREENKNLTPEKAEKEIFVKAQKLNQLRSLAILVPSEHNVLQYLQAQKLLIDQSSHFASSWEKVLLSYPELGSFLETPTSSYG